jgi:hypothetical protein
MRKTKILWVPVILAFVIGMALHVPPPSLDLDNKVPEKTGLPPAWNVGDSWTYVSSAGTIFDYSVVGEENYDGVPSYRLTGTISPPLDGWASRVDKVFGKETLAVSCEVFYDTGRARTERFVRTYSKEPWPLRAGKTYTEGVTSEKIYTQGADSWSDPKISREYRIRVETVEDVAVEAGIFESYKISVWEVDNLIKERWYSYEVKNFVKIIDHRTGEVTELSSYQIG